jgi:hypothetical protein
LTLPQGQDLSISGVQVWAGDTDVTAQATVSSSFAPSEGALSALTDGDAGTVCVWVAQQVRQPGFYIELTFASAVEITRAFLGAAVYTAALSGAASVINVVAAMPGGVQVGALPWVAKDALGIGAVGFWSLNGATSAQPDEVAGVRNATRSGGSVVDARLAADSLQAFDPQVSGSIRIPSVTGVDAAGFSIAIDFQYTTTVNSVIAEHGNNNNGWSLQALGTSGIAFGVPDNLLSFCAGVSGSNFAMWFSDEPVNDGKPHRAVITVSDFGIVKIFLDGREATRRGSNPVIGNRTYNTSYVDIGSRGGAAGLAAGSRLANFALFTRTLSWQEARRLSLSVGWPVQTLQQSVWLADYQPQWLAQGAGATASPRVAALDMENGGRGYIYGTVELFNQAGNLPLPRRVRLHRSRDGLLVRETWSNAQGQYRFEGINQRYTYDVIAWDHEGLQRSVVANDLTPEVLP